VASTLSALLLSGAGPVALALDERVELFAWLVLAPTVLVLGVAALFARGRWSAVGYGLVPAATLGVLALASHEATLGAWPDPDLQYRALGGVLVLGVLLRGRLAPPLCAALAATVLGTTVWMLPERSPSAAGDDRLVVLLTLDTTRGDAFDFIDDRDAASTPELSALARTSTVFREAHAPIGLTGPAHTSFFTSQAPIEHDVLGNGEIVGADLPWLPTELQAEGWTTRAYVSASVLDAVLGFDRGFTVFDSTFQGRLARAHPLMRFRGYQNLPGSAHSRPANETLELVDLEPEGPTFVWVHLYDAHWPYTPTVEAAEAQGLEGVLELPDTLRGPGVEDDERRRGHRQYLAEVSDLDAAVEALLERLPPDATLVVVGDHGESMGEHGDWFTHGHDSRRAVSHVPWLVRGPDWPAQVVEEPVSTVGVGPMLRDICGLGAEVSSTVWVETVAMKSGALKLGPEGRDRFINGTVRDANGSTTVHAEGGLESEGLADDRRDAAATDFAARAALAGGGTVEPSLAVALEALGYVEP